MKAIHFISWVRRYGWLFLIAGVALLIALSVTLIGRYMSSQTTVWLGDGVFQTSLATTSQAREKGLSGTDQLAPDRAMLFVFDTSDRWGIWMKDMNYPIDVVWLNDQKQVVYSVSNMNPDSYPEVFTPKESARYVVELAAGTIASKAIHTGGQAQFSVANRDGQ
jgi:uncharacterized protein